MKRALLGLTFLLAGFVAVSQDTRTLLTIEDEKVTVDEFLSIYNKNNTANVVDKKTIDEYLDLFVNFKLKVKEAESLGMDTAKKFVNELSGYRRQLAQPYLVDRALNDQLIEEAYARMKEDVAANHILIKVAENASPADTLAALKRIKKIASGISSQDEMERAIAKLSADDDKSTIAEDLGYFTAFSMVYPFENSAYKTPIGKLSKPVRTRFGYHVIFVKDKRPARGEIRTSHIMIKSNATMTPEEQKNAGAKIQEIHAQLLAGGDFEALAKEYSEDKGTAAKGGLLPWFGTGRMVDAFENAAFSLENNGDISVPVQTSYGWHIIRREDYKGIGTFDELKGSIKKKIERDSRGQKGRVSLLKTLKREYALTFNNKNRDIVHKNVTSEFLEGTWQPAEGVDLNGPLITITDNKYSGKTVNFTQNDYIIYLKKFQKRLPKGQMLKDVLATKWESYINAALIEFEDGVLAYKHPAFKALLQEYHDGILLFDLMDQKVWSKAVKDSAGLADYYEAHKNDFMWGKRVDASVYICASEDIASKAEKLAKKRVKKSLTDSAIESELNEDNALNVSIRSGVYSEKDDEYVDQVEWIPGIHTLALENGKVALVQIHEVRFPQPKTLNESRGLVTSAYQSHLEKLWIEELRGKFTYSVDQAVFNDIKK